MTRMTTYNSDRLSERPCQ